MPKLRLNPVVVGLGLAVALIVAVLLVVLLKTNPEVASRVTPKQLEARLTRNCQNDRRFRLQYKQRAEVEQHFLGLYIRENKAFLSVAQSAQLHHLSFVLKAADATARTLIASIHIIPVPHCSGASSQ